MNYYSLKQYNKFLVAFAAALAILGTALSDGAVSGDELIQIAVAFLGSLGVYQVRND